MSVKLRFNPSASALRDAGREPSGRRPFHHERVIVLQTTTINERG